jgi:hypothetical protein
MTVPAERLYQDVAYLAFHLHWSRDELLDLEHAERQRFVDEVGRLQAHARRG